MRSFPKRALLIGLIISILLEAGSRKSNADSNAGGAEASENSLESSNDFGSVSDQEWNDVVADKTKLKYKTKKGDTLRKIAKDLFGDEKFWVKIYITNRKKLKYSTKIKPGVTLSFKKRKIKKKKAQRTIAKAETLKIVVNDLKNSVADALLLAKNAPVHSQEWKDLQKQPWETFKTKTTADVDPLGFDRKNKIRFAKAVSFGLKAIPSTNKLNLLGQIVGAKSESNYLSLNDTVYIRGDQDLQVGESYAITREPSLLKSPKSDRVGYSYLLLGKVKIVGVREKFFIGIITAAKDHVDRGNSIIALPPPSIELTPIPGPRALQGLLFFDHNFSTYTAAQHKEVFVDRGSDDGVKPGMVFRAYQHYDPANQKRITTSDFIIDADIMIMHVSENFSSGIVISNLNPIEEYSPVVLLTDVSDLQKHTGFREKDTKTDELDELENLDRQGTAGSDERRELIQLENWKGNPPGTSDGSEGNPPLPPVQGNTDLPPPSTNEGLPPPDQNANKAPEPGTIDLKPVEQAPQNTTPTTDQGPAPVDPPPVDSSQPAPAGDEPLPPPPTE